MAAKKSSIKKPVLPVEEILIPELADEPVKFVCQLQPEVDQLTEQSKANGNVGWSVILAYKCIQDDDNDSIFTIKEWSVFQAANRALWEEEIVPILMRVNGFDRAANKKKLSNQKSG